MANSLSFVNMCQSIGSYGHGFKPPPMHEFSTWIFKGNVKITEIIVYEVKKTRWPERYVSQKFD